jgi:RimJ/RimL family protein N-acetyltransferase
MKLQTKRLILRAPTKKDVDDLVEGMNNIKISQWLVKVPYPYKKKDALWWVNNCKEDFQKKKNRESYAFNIELKEEKKIIGGCGLHNYNKFNESVEIGYWINEKYWKKGIITEAGIAVIDFAFKKLKVNRIGLYAYSKNEASNAVAKKLGFSLEGKLRQYHKALATKRIHDANCYSLLRGEWSKNKKRLLNDRK